MKKLIIALLCLIIPRLVNAGELKIRGYIKPDPIRGANHYLITNDDGNVKARVKPDLIRPPDSGHYLIIDKDGSNSGRIRPDYINNGSYIFETAPEK